jgi:hypothetical protein
LVNSNYLIINYFLNFKLMFIEEWPEGTQINKLPDGKKEIVFREPTNFKKANRPISTKSTARVLAEKQFEAMQRGGVSKEDKVLNKGDHRYAQKKVPTRQEQINQDRQDQRMFKEEQKQSL